MSDIGSQHVKVRSLECLLNWHICRPSRRNAIGPTLLTELIGHTRDLQQMLAAKDGLAGQTKKPLLLLITAEACQGANGTIWSAGGDLAELAALSHQEAEIFFASIRHLRRVWRSLPILIVTAVTGLAIGGGAEFAMFADTRYMTATASLHFKQLEVGLPLGFIGSAELTRLIGASLVQRLLFRREIVPAASAVNYGLMHGIIPAEKEHDLMEWAIAEFSALESTAVCAQKYMLQSMATDEMPAPLSAGAKGLADLTVTERRELDAFLAAWRNPTHARILGKFGGDAKPKIPG